MVEERYRGLLWCWVHSHWHSCSVVVLSLNGVAVAEVDRAGVTINGTGAHRGPRREHFLWVLCAAALTGALVLAVTASGPDPAKRVLQSTTTLATTTITTRTPPAGLARSLPRELIVPSLGIDSGVGQLGLLADHHVQVPTSVHTVGWFRLGPTPGQIGSSVILGHVDSYAGPGIFFNIKSLPVGALIEVGLADHTMALFRVTSVVQYAKSSFPDALVYGSSEGRNLNLVTCGGTFDRSTRSYESNIVVFSRLVGVRTTTTR